MYSKQNILIYPYDSHFVPILRNKNFRDSYNKIFLSSLHGWGLCEKDAGFADGGNNLNITIGNKFDEYLNLVDSVVFVKPDSNYQFEQNIYPKMLNAIDAGKNIINLIDLGDRETEIEEYCKKKDVIFKNYINGKIKNVNMNNNLNERRVLDIYTPIVAVMGLSENTHKFHIQLELKSQLEMMGYKVSLIGSRGYCDFLGFNSFPSFMTDCNISECDKIYLFNNFIKEIELTEKPDLIIIGIPGGILPYNSNISNNFGIIPYEIFQSIIPDISIVSIFHEFYTAKYLELISNTIKYRFGFDVDAFNIVNRQIDWVEMVNANPDKIAYVTLNPEYMRGRLIECKEYTSIPLYNILGIDDPILIANMIIGKLAECKSEVTFL